MVWHILLVYYYSVSFCCFNDPSSCVSSFVSLGLFGSCVSDGPPCVGWTVLASDLDVSRTYMCTNCSIRATRKNPAPTRASKAGKLTDSPICKVLE